MATSPLSYSKPPTEDLFPHEDEIRLCTDDQWLELEIYPGGCPQLQVLLYIHGNCEQVLFSQSFD